MDESSRIRVDGTMALFDTSNPGVAAPGLAASGAKIGESRRVNLDDTVLVREAQQGNTVAFEKLVRQYDRTVLSIAIRITGSQDDGQDIYQEAFLRAYKNLLQFRFECSFYTWIYRIVTNLCLDYLRKKSRRRDVIATVSWEDEEQDLLDRLPDPCPSASPERRLVARELSKCIFRAMQALSPRERIVFEFKHYHGLKLRAVASILNTTEGTVKNALFRATQKLRTQLAEVR